MNFKLQEVVISRIEKVSQLLKEEISRILREDLEDPNLGFVTVTKVKISKDLKHALVLISVLGDEREQKKSINIINNASGLVKKIIADVLPLKFVPEIKFILDKSLEYSVYIDEKIDQIRREDER